MMTLQQEMKDDVKRWERDVGLALSRLNSISHKP